MEHVTHAGEDAGRLLAFALNPTLRPAHDDDYADLAGRYRVDPLLRALTDAVAKGLGLIVLDSSDQGLVLGAQDGSPFAMKLSDYRANMSLEERVCHGLIQLAIAAWCFPTAADLDDPDGAVKKVSASQVTAYLVRLAEALDARATDDDVPGATPELEQAWQAVLSRARTKATADGRRAPKTLVAMVAYALERLEKGGLVRRVGDDDGGVWKTLSRYRVQVRELAAHRAFALVLDAGRAAPRGELDGDDTAPPYVS